LNSTLAIIGNAMGIKMTAKVVSKNSSFPLISLIN